MTLHKRVTDRTLARPLSEENPTTFARVFQEKLKPVLALFLVCSVALLSWLEPFPGYQAVNILMVGALVGITVRERYFPGLVVVLTLLPGKSPFLLNLSFWMMVIAVLCLVRFGQILGRKSKFRTNLSGRWTFIGIALYCGILAGHFIMNQLGWGTGSLGGRYIFVTAVLVIVACYLLQADWFESGGYRFIPLLGVFVGLFDVTLEGIIWIFPVTVHRVLDFYSGVNWEILEHYYVDGDYQIARFCALRTLGLMLGLYCLVGLTRGAKLSARRVSIHLIGVAVALGLVLCAGYRSYLLSLMIAMGLSSLCRGIKWAVLTVSALLFVFAMVSITHVWVAPVPYPIQRTLSWFPGDWDQEIKAEITHGWKLRTEIWETFQDELLPESPVIGHGRRWFPEDPSAGAPNLIRSQAQQFLYQRQAMHSGFFASLDFMGVLGMALLVLVSIRANYLVFVHLTSRRTRLEGWMMWIILFFVSWQPVFWITGDFEPQICTLTLCISAMELIHRKNSKDRTMDTSWQPKQMSDPTG